jgi:alkylated DNA repair dioxygenase AlkB
MKTYSMSDAIGFLPHELANDHRFYSGRLPKTLLVTSAEFEALWEMHPSEYHKIKIHGRLVRTPRWQQAYGNDYHYTGRVNKALPMPPILEPLLTWCREAIEPRLNGLLLNWYDSSLGHYIGKHRDSTKNMVSGAPIVTVSFGDTRTFRLRPWKGQGYRDFAATDGTVFIMPYETNLVFTHEVPRAGTSVGKRISVTLRAFHN